MIPTSIKPVALVTLAVVMALPLVVASADRPLDGTWSFDVSLNDGQGGTAIITLREGEEGELSGNYSGALGEEPISGKVNGKSIHLSFRSSAGTVAFHGQLAEDDGTISGTCNYGQLGDGTFEARKMD